MKRSLLIAAAAVALLALLVPLYAGPATALAPRDLPIVVAGPAPAAGALAARLPADFAPTVVADAAAADRALRDREAYGAVVLTPAGPVLHVASAAGPAVAAALTQAAPRLGITAPVVDVVPTSPDDPRGAGFAAGLLPLAMAAMAAGVLLALAAGTRGARLAGLAAFTTLAGLVGAAVLDLWLGVAPGGYWAVAAAVGLVTGAIAATVAGLGAVLGRAGVALGAVVVFLVGNALSAVASAPELLPQPWGEVGQWLPVGAGATLLRSVAYFDGAGAGQAAWTLAAYLVIGAALAAAARTPRPARTAAAPDRELVTA
ncbi:hypothetical protein [Spirilliplanes yamanashiensis]|uniref:ABC transporter permease n=1 Tax=Spirilliplanes yamanashiensis TaxID=42233 RepID=A0A8J4DH27_9ACTN|nr:hypothetical protein [Spirilliplanes yamanashiensis]MDP9814193.1 hypothetical protein [Spirilliplanes yamanashiensis]GIJ00825.1 hypothetical protein Sya03_01770 [Spirilliplanes yamanashiensis]